MPTAPILGSNASLVAAFIFWCFISCAIVTAREASAAAAPKLIEATESSDVFHLDLLLQHEHSAKAMAPSTPWFDGFGEGTAATGAVAVATVVHPIRRMLVHLRQEGVRLDEAMSWAERGGMIGKTSYCCITPLQRESTTGTLVYFLLLFI